MRKKVLLSFILSLLLSFVCSKSTKKTSTGILNNLKPELKGNRSLKALGRLRGEGISFRSGWNPLKPPRLHGNNSPLPLDQPSDNGEDPCVGACGANQDCYLMDVTPLCTCKSGFIGHPFSGCVPGLGRCSSNSDCSTEKACLNNLCADPCEGACSSNTECMVTNHLPTCACDSATTWNPTFGCVPKPKHMCTANEQCPADRACVGRKCVDPCVGLCGKNTVCKLNNRQPACSCLPGYYGNAFQDCKPSDEGMTEEPSIKKKKPSNLKGKKKFSLINEQKNWVEALAHCRSLDMDLATIENKVEELEMGNALKFETPFTNVWTSGTDLGNMNNFIWASSGNPVDFGAFGVFTPSSEPKEFVTCIEVRSIRGRAQWRSYSCRSKQPFLCQYYE